MAKILTTLTLLLTLGVGQMWGDNGYWDTGTWQIWVWPGTGSDTWMGTYNKSATADWGVITTSSYYIKGVGANTWGSGVTSTELWWSLNGKTYGGTIGTGSTSGNYYWEKKNLTDVDIVAKAANNPGNNTITCYFKLNGSDNFTSYINFTLPGFTTTSTSKTFSNTTVSSTTDATISFGQHYGTALSTNNCALSGTNSTEFEVRSISETGVTVRFKPSSNGSKSATLTITDAHSKTCTITLSGKTQRAVTYKKGDNGTGSDQTDYKVYNTNLTLRNSGDFTRSYYQQTAWNTNSNGTSGASYALGATYTSNDALTLYPTWAPNNYDITYKDQGGGAYSGSNSGSLPSSYTYGTGIAALTNGVRTGYLFAGWYNNSGCTGDAVTSISNSANGDKTLYAKWTAITISEVSASPSSGSTGVQTMTVSFPSTLHPLVSIHLQ